MTWNLDVICIVESWLNENVTDAELSNRGMFSVFRYDRGRRGGGVLILVKHDITCIRNEISHDDCEMVSIDILNNEDTVTRIIAAYSPGTEGPEQDFQSMQNLVRSIELQCNTDVPVIVTGDFNCPNIDWGNQQCNSLSTPREKMFLESCLLNSLDQLVKSPTRPSSGTIVDLILCSDECIESDEIHVCNGPIDSDHRGLRFKMSADLPLAAEGGSMDWDRAD